MSRKVNVVAILIAALPVSLFSDSATAASIGFDSATYSGEVGSTIQVSLTYDFTDLSALFAGLEVTYDVSVLEFVSFELGPYTGTSGSPLLGISSAGTLEVPGFYAEILIIGDLFNGISDSGIVGSFEFVVLGAGGDAGCGGTLCLSPDPVTPMFSLDGVDITDIVLSNSDLTATVIPVPGAIWMFLSGISFFAFGSVSRSARIRS